MNTFITIILEIIKITVPALIVFATVYYLMKQYLDSQYQLRTLEYRQNQQKTTTPMRLQAYERLSLLCERIALPNLVLRLRQPEMKALDLRMAILISVQQEFEHNITQQIYVSENLWEILKIGRDDVTNIANQAYKEVGEEASLEEYIQAMFTYWNSRDVIPLNSALAAIKKEAGMMLG